MKFKHIVLTSSSFIMIKPTEDNICYEKAVMNRNRKHFTLFYGYIRSRMVLLSPLQLHVRGAYSLIVITSSW